MGTGKKILLIIDIMLLLIIYLSFMFYTETAIIIRMLSLTLYLNISFYLVISGS